MTLKEYIRKLEARRDSNWNKASDYYGEWEERMYWKIYDELDDVIKELELIDGPVPTV